MRGIMVVLRPVVIVNRGRGERVAGVGWGAVHSGLGVVLKTGGLTLGYGRRLTTLLEPQKSGPTVN